ncbi:MAG TPA: endonuclease/exonuclease/phosphatase family protein [Streptosporangiaceae bacterium]|nr:endonuclease/exonuclease/phosphatase family protein [Streptosporangiaceae bacterium]
MTAGQQMSLFPAQSPARPAATDTVRLMVFNTQHASPGRARAQVTWIAAQDDADLLILTEVSAGPGGHSLIQALAENGYSSVLAPEPAEPDYRAVLASRGPVLTPIPGGISVFSHRGPAAAADIGGHRIGLLGLYVPSRGPRQRRNENKRAFQDAVTGAVPALVARFSDPLIIAGDLNVVEPGHIPHLPVFGEWEYAFYRSFLEAGMTDAYRQIHPQAGDHSWFGRSGTGYRLDHIFITSPHAPRVRDCGYLQAPRHLGLTDHAAMTIRCQLDLSAAENGR